MQVWRTCFGIMTVLLYGSTVLGQTPAGVNLAAMQGWDIVVAEDAIPSERYAAQEFQKLLAEACGKKLPIVTGMQGVNHHVFIGSGEAMRCSNVGFSTEHMGAEDLRIIVRDGNIAIAGGRPRGTLYGVYTFLEDYLGIRFLTYDHTYVPKVGRWCMVGPVDRFYHPPLEFRWSYYEANRVHSAFAARLRVNTDIADPSVGGSTELSLINHSFYHHLPVKEYSQEHPEYFALVDGKRKMDVGGGGPQLCLTNPDVLKIVTASVLRDLEQNPQVRNISVSQNDNNLHCQCENCAAIDKREGTPMGSLLTFVNAIADEVAKKHPDVMVGTLSYQYSRRAPKHVKPRPNVQIQLCTIECSIIQSIDDPTCKKNAAFYRDMTEWGKISKNIYIWNYNTNFVNYLLPFPNLRVIGPNISYFVANNAKGIFMQAVYNTVSGELSDLRNYVITNLLWDPSRNGQQLMDEFLTLHYGSAAEPIRRFINHVHDNAEASGLQTNCFGSAKSYAVDASVAQAGLDAFAEAMKLAENDVVRHRVEKASMCAYRAAIEPIWYFKKSSEVDPALAERMRPLVKRYLLLCDKYNLTYDGEGRPFAPVRERLRSVLDL